MRNASWSTVAVGALTALVAAALLVSPATAALSAPVTVRPADGTTTDALPVFAWEPVQGAAGYQWEISADPGFNSPVLGSGRDSITTGNTRATLVKVVPNGTYWWHVRSVDASGSVSPWSPARAFTKQSGSAPALLAPANGATVVYPRDHFRLEWAPVAGAAHYRVSIATDPSLGSLVWSGGAIKTQATAFTLAKPLAPDQTYYWGVTPLDAAGNPGFPSSVRSFRWAWPTTTVPRVADVAAEPEIYDFEFSWDAVPGAAGYEVEINTSSDFAPGSRVCPNDFRCKVYPATGTMTIGTSWTPSVALPNNRYYWRVRAIDPSKNAGVWNEGPTFVKSFDNVLPSVRNLRLAGNPAPAAWPVSTHAPALEWDPVPGASSYEVDVTVYTADGCQWTTTVEHWTSRTSTPAWTPLGWGWNGRKPFASDLLLAWDVPRMVPGHEYCVRVTALDKPSDSSSPYVRSVETYLPDRSTPAFEWLGTDPGAPCTAPCESGSLGAGDYLAPVGGIVERDMPLLRWKPLEGYESYFVLVSKDENFTNLVDYAFTRIAAYAPRLGSGPRTYPDETTEYYWTVLPARNADGSGVTTAPRFSAPQSFHKQSLPPALLGPPEGTAFAEPTRFHWSAAVAAQRYELQVSSDPTFSTGIAERIITDSTVYTSIKTYSADTTLYWRVRADAEGENAASVGLTWSRTGTFRKTLAAPVPDAANPTRGDAVPTWTWAPVPGAVSYDFEFQQPDGQPRAFDNIPSAAATPVVFQGTGIWKWRVRANFPVADLLQTVDGPWMPLQPFTRTIPEPPAPSEEASPTAVAFSWQPRMGALNYRVQVSTRPDFTGVFDSVTTDNTAWAPNLNNFRYQSGGTFYWRVAAADHLVLNVGDYTQPRSFALPVRAPSGTKLGSTTTATVATTRAKVKVSGSVFPAHAGKRVVVKLYRKRSGTFHLLAKKRPTLDSLSRYSAAFSRPRRGACKAVVHFGGDADHQASARRVFFRC